jgi:hypothetical protein
LIRDGRGFCNSFIKNKGISRSALKIAAEVWKKYIEKVDILVKRLEHVEILEVKYGDLCSRPDIEISRICNFIGVESKEDILKNSIKDMHILGNRMRFEFTGEVREDNKWKSNLYPDEIEMLTRYLKPELKRFTFI